MSPPATQRVCVTYQIRHVTLLIKRQSQMSPTFHCAEPKRKVNRGAGVSFLIRQSQATGATIFATRCKALRRPCVKWPPEIEDPRSYAPVAQRIERLPPEQEAAGSSPAGRTNFHRNGGDFRARLNAWPVACPKCVRRVPRCPGSGLGSAFQRGPSRGTITTPPIGSSRRCRARNWP